MSAPLISTTPSTPVSKAAAQMREHDVGALVAMEAGKVAGIVTDRDIVIRSLAQSSVDSLVADAMTPEMIACRAGQDVTEACALMGDHQVRRLLVLDERGRPVGIVSLADIAEHASERLAGESLGEISEDRSW